tara:strand:- start:599 stop:1291 length:693 start_codon:yes stop_codon:yes gene_type:complete
LEATDVRGLLGLLIADGSLVPYRTPSGGYVQLTLTAGLSENAFLEEKVEEFKQFIFTRAKIVPYKTKPRLNGSRTSILRFRVSTNKLRPIYNLLYPVGDKQITQIALDLLGAQAAAWLWAEGAKINKDGSSSLIRVGSTEEEATMVAQWLQMLVGASGKLDENHVRPRLVFNPEQTQKLQEQLIPYAPKSRSHLFKQELWDVSSIRSARTELHLGKGEHQSQGEKTKTMA